MSIKGVIFDFNGTLYWDTELHNQAWDLFLEKNRIFISDEEKNTKIHGKNNIDILKSLVSRDLSSGEMARMSIEKEDIYQGLCLKHKLGLAPGCVSFFNFLKKQHVPFTIATAADLYNVDFYFSHLNLGLYFDKSKVIYSDGTIPSKPDPELFHKALRVLGLEADEILIFEDSKAGIEAAENAGAAKILIVNSTNSDYNNWNHQVITSFEEVKRELFGIDGD
jgi:beta-phosphoglucomutase